MRPNGVESIRAIQSGLAEVIAPELTSPFAQDAAQVLQMLLESVAAEWDSAADNLRSDNRRLAELLGSAQQALKSVSDSNETFAVAVSEIEQRLSEEQGDSITVSDLSSRNDALRGTLDQALIALEEAMAEAAPAAIPSVRAAAYAHLRDVATRGWSFWDVSSFRGRMTAVRAAAKDDAPQTPAVE